MTTFQIGSRVHCILYGGRNGVVYAIRGEQQPGTIRSLGGGCVVMGGSAYLDIVFEDGSKSCVPESIAHGVQWRVLPGLADAVEIAGALAAAASKVASDKAKADEAAERRRLEVERIKAEYSYLIQGADCVTAAKNLRTELKRAFHSVKFSVRTSRYSGGNSIDVGWTDGPTTEQVKAISDKYQEGNFDGMTDSYEFSRAPWTDVFGGAMYVMENRHHSEAFIARAIEALKVEYNATNAPTIEEFRNGRANGTPIGNAEGEHHWCWQSLIHRKMAEMEG